MRHVGVARAAGTAEGKLGLGLWEAELEKGIWSGLGEGKAVILLRNVTGSRKGSLGTA